MWRCPNDASRILFSCETKETGEQCLSGGWVRLKGDATCATSGGAVSELKCGRVFEQMSERLRSRPDLAKKVGATFVWEIMSSGQKAAEWGKPAW